jgi:hypothetical protein
MNRPHFGQITKNLDRRNRIFQNLQEEQPKTEARKQEKQENRKIWHIFGIF